MTLIAAFRTYEGVVLCADSQETIDIPERGQYRVNVNKIEKREAGDCEVVIGGSGDGDLVDDFVDLLVDRIGGWAAGKTEPQMRDDIRNFLQHYYEVYVALSPAHEDDKRLGFVICVKSKAQQDVFLWRTSDLRIRLVTDKTLLGWEEAIYWHEVDQLYQPNWISNHAMLLGLHLFAIAKATSNYISGETKVIVARDTGIQTLPSDDVRDLEAMLAAFNKMVNELRLILPNMSIPLAEFNGYVANFAAQVIGMRTKLLERAVDQSITKALDPQWAGDAFARIPAGQQLKITLSPKNDPARKVEFKMSFEELLTAMALGEGHQNWNLTVPALFPVEVGMDLDLEITSDSDVYPIVSSRKGKAPNGKRVD